MAFLWSKICSPYLHCFLNWAWSQGRFDYLVSNNDFGPGQLFHCDTVPGDLLQIVYIHSMLINLPPELVLLTESEKIYAKISAQTFYQDCKIFSDYRMSYERYVDRVILNLIESQTKLINATVCNKGPRLFDLLQLL